jgi:hypothetical protein
MEELSEIFSRLRPLIAHYNPPLQPKHDDPSYYDLWSFKELTIEGRKRKEVFFAGLIIQKNYVGFYYMPVYAEPEMKEFFKPELLGLLKGKSCFHIKKITPELLTQVAEALELGFRKYQERGWI